MAMRFNGRSLVGVSFTLMCLMGVLSPGDAGAETFHVTTADHDDDNAASGTGADTYICGSDSSRDFESTNFGSEEELWVKADRPYVTGTTRKTYLRFDLSALPDAEVTGAKLVLTTSVLTNNNAEAEGEYRLRLWGLAHDAEGQDWVEAGGDDSDEMARDDDDDVAEDEEGSDTDDNDDADEAGDDDAAAAITWLGAPGNDTETGTEMDHHAVLLAEIVIEPNPARGAAIEFTNDDSLEENALIGFLNGDDDGRVTLMITAAEHAGQKTGWRFASKESQRFDGPVLVVETAE